MAENHSGMNFEHYSKMDHVFSTASSHYSAFTPMILNIYIYSKRNPKSAHSFLEIYVNALTYCLSA